VTQRIKPVNDRKISFLEKQSATRRPATERRPASLLGLRPPSVGESTTVPLWAAAERRGRAACQSSLEDSQGTSTDCMPAAQQNLYMSGWSGEREVGSVARCSGESPLAPHRRSCSVEFGEDPDRRSRFESATFCFVFYSHAPFPTKRRKIG